MSGRTQPAHGTGLPPLAGRRYRQSIPRPPTAVTGGLAPWSELPASSRRPISLGRVVAALGVTLQLPPGGPGPRPAAAVLVPLFERDGDTHVILIRRSPLLLRNPWDLAFPGGRLEDGESPLEAALREAREEVGLDPASITVLGCLEPVQRVRHSERVVPFVGTLEREPALRADPGEVDAVLAVSFSDLAAEGVYWEEEWPVPGEGSRTLSFFADPACLGDDVIWGMTARVIRLLLSAVLVRGEHSEIA